MTNSTPRFDFHGLKRAAVPNQKVGRVAEQQDLIAVVAHGLLNDLAAIQGLLSTARRQIDPATPELDRADHLLSLAELRAITTVESLRRYAWGLGADEPPSLRLVDDRS